MSKHARRRRYRARRATGRLFARLVNALRAAGGGIDLGVPPYRAREAGDETAVFQIGWL